MESIAELKAEIIEELAEVCSSFYPNSDTDLAFIELSGELKKRAKELRDIAEKLEEEKFTRKFNAIKEKYKRGEYVE